MGTAEDQQADRRWYAVISHPRKEALALQHLERQGFGAYLPLVSQVVRLKTRTVTVPKAFFPGYLFVSLDVSAHRWRSVNGTYGVTGLVSFGDRLAPTPRGLIERLRELTAATGERCFEDPLQPGAQVRVVGGPMDRFVGVFQGQDAGSRVRSLILAGLVWFTVRRIILSGRARSPVWRLSAVCSWGR
jgi:transcription elongation factor/antiterminator RfaH